MLARRRTYGPCHHMERAALAGAMLVVWAAWAEAAAAQRFDIPKLIRITGHVGDPLPTDKGAEDWYFGYKDTQIRFQCLDLKVLSDATLPGSIVAHVDLYRPNFMLFGDPKLMAKLQTATPNETVQIVGYYRRVGRDILVNEVTVGPGAGGATTTPGAAD